MSYSLETKEAAKAAPKGSLGSQLIRWAIAKNFSVLQIAKVTGATRQTVYNWGRSGQITQAYRERAQILIDILRAAPTGEEAWKMACRRFNLLKK